MAILQISQIQVRRGLQQDLPQLASGELGWSLDQRRLFIGNGTLTEGAPAEGTTEILTQYSNFLNTIPNYTFAGTDSGYTSITGTNSLNPVTRTLQSVLDESISVKDFGATGNGLTDDTVAINRAIQQVYVAGLNNVHINVQRTIRFPAGTYLISSPIIVPPNCTLLGDGKNNTVITATTGTILTTSDSQFQTGNNIGNAGAFAPKYIFIAGMKFQTQAGSSPVVIIDSTNDIVFDNVYFAGATSVTNLVTTAASVATTNTVTFSKCVFDTAVNGYTATGTTQAVRIANSTFQNLTGVSVNINSYMSGFVSENNYFASTVATALSGLTGNNYSFGDSVSNSTQHGGIYSGSAKYGTGQTVYLTTGTTTVRTLANGAGTLDYQLTDSSGNFRFGTLKYNTSGAVTVFDDEFTEPSTSLGANLFANASGYLTCAVTNSTTLRYNIKQFI